MLHDDHGLTLWNLSKPSIKWFSLVTLVMVSVTTVTDSLCHRKAILRSGNLNLLSGFLHKLPGRDTACSKSIYYVFLKRQTSNKEFCATVSKCVEMQNISEKLSSGTIALCFCSTHSKSYKTYYGLEPKCTPKAHDLVPNASVFRDGAFDKWLYCDGYDLMNGFICLCIHDLMSCWEVVGTLGGSVYVEEISHWRCACQRSISFFSCPWTFFLFAAAIRWAPFSAMYFHHDELPHWPRGTRANTQGLKLLKLQSQ